MVASPSSKKVNMPAAARSGLVLLLLGALIVGLGSYFGSLGEDFHFMG